MDHQYNNHQAGSGTRCRLATAAKGCLQTNLTCSRTSPAPEERPKSFCANQHPPWERAAQSHAPIGQRCSSPGPPYLSTVCSKPVFQTRPLPSTAAPSPRYHLHHRSPSNTLFPTTKRNKQETPHPKNSKIEAKGFPSCGLKWAGFAGFCKFPLRLEPAFNLRCKGPSRKKPTFKKQQGAIRREQGASSSPAPHTHPVRSCSQGCWCQSTDVHPFTPPGHPTGQRKGNLLSCCSRSKGRTHPSSATPPHCPRNHL